MKRVIFLSLLLPLYSIAQSKLPLKDGKVFYEEIDSVPGAQKADLYTRSKVWFVNTFKSANAVLQMDDKEGGIIMGEGITSLEVGNFMTGSLHSNIHYTININEKDGKYRIQVYDIYVSNSENAATYTPEDLLKYPKMNRKKIERIDASVTGLMATLKASMSQKASDF